MILGWQRMVANPMSVFRELGFQTHLNIFCRLANHMEDLSQLVRFFSQRSAVYGSLLHWCHRYAWGPSQALKYRVHAPALAPAKTLTAGPIALHPFRMTS